MKQWENMKLITMTVNILYYIIILPIIINIFSLNLKIFLIHEDDCIGARNREVLIQLTDKTLVKKRHTILVIMMNHHHYQSLQPECGYHQTDEWDYKFLFIYFKKQEHNNYNIMKMTT